MKKRNKISFRKLGSLICFIIVAIFICIMVRNFMAINTDENTDNIKLFGYRPVVVVSGSMEPAIAVNSVSIMQYCDIDELNVGDIVMYRHPSLNINITHRVIEKGEDVVGNTYIKTQGDANSAPDNLKITNDMVVGKLIKTYNETAPYVSFVMLENGEVNTFALLQIIILIAVTITVLCMIVYLIWAIISSILFVLFGSKRLEYTVETYKNNIDFQNDRLELVENLHYQKGDGIRGLIAKILFARQLKAFEESARDLEKTYNLYKFLKK